MLLTLVVQIGEVAGNQVSPAISCIPSLDQTAHAVGCTYVISCRRDQQFTASLAHQLVVVLTYAHIVPSATYTYLV
jgi:hypothetical protein